MNRKVLFIDGPIAGEIRELPEGMNYYAVPLPLKWDLNTSLDTLFSAVIEQHHYYIHPCHLFGHDIHLAAGGPYDPYILEAKAGRWLLSDKAKELMGDL